MIREYSCFKQQGYKEEKKNYFKKKSARQFYVEKRQKAYFDFKNSEYERRKADVDLDKKSKQYEWLKQKRKEQELRNSFREERIRRKNEEEKQIKQRSERIKKQLIKSTSEAIEKLKKENANKAQEVKSWKQQMKKSKKSEESLDRSDIMHERERQKQIKNQLIGRYLKLNKVNPQKKYFRRMMKTQRHRIEQQKITIDILQVQKWKNEKKKKKSMQKIEKINEKMEVLKKDSRRMLHQNPRNLILERR